MSCFNVTCLWKKKIAPISSSVSVSLEQDWTPLRHKYVIVNKQKAFELLDKMEILLKEMETTALRLQEEGDIYSTPLESKKSTMS